MTRFSVVIPTYRRRELVLRNVLALDHQQMRDFETIVVDDGSADGTAAALRALSPTFPLIVIEQPNQGAAEARNVGARAAKGELLLFLDDDMEADPALLREHDRCHREGAGLVLGHMPVHPDSPPGLLSWAVGYWGDSRRDRLVASQAEIGLDDLLTGQISIGREDFFRVGGFDTSFTREGLFGGEDIDFGYRALKAGLKPVFDPDAISYQYYAVDPAAYLRRARETGRSEEELVLKHPEQASRLDAAPDFSMRRSRWLLGPLSAAPLWVSWPLRSFVVALVRSGRRDSLTRRLFFAVRTMEHRRGGRLARRKLSTGRAFVLAFHAVSDLSTDPVLAEYGVAPRRLGEYLDALSRRGWAFIGLDELIAALEGRADLPSRAVLVTFDDCYVDLLDSGAQVLAERDVPAVAFAVAGLTGATNEWDRPLGARELRLLDAEGLRRLAARGVVIGSHAMSHRPLARLEPQEVASEVEGSAARLESLGLPRPRALSYPHGESSPTVETAARKAGYSLAFTVTPGAVEVGSNRWALPRVEVLASDSPRGLQLKLATARWPSRLRQRAWRLARRLR